MKRWFALGIGGVLLVAGGLFYMSFPPEVAKSDYQVRDMAYAHVNTLPMDNGVTYGQTPWSGAHRDSRNSDHIPLPSPNAMRRTWTGIANGTFFMPPTLGAEGNVYATSGGGEGHSHLHAFDGAGNLLWKAAPQVTLDDLDSAAFFSAPVVDIDNHLFVPDSNQLWSFDAKGTVRWVTDLEALGVIGYAFSTYFTHTGHIGLISSDGKVALFDRGSGNLAMPILDLPGVSGLPSSPTPPGLLEGVDLDPAIYQDNWDAIWGFNMEVANTPSVHPESGRIFIVATGREANQTVLYGIDVLDEGLAIGFETLLGENGSGTSPTISFDGRFVYVIDGQGRLTAVKTDTGAIAWKAHEPSVTGVSSSTMPEGKVFTFQFNEVICWDGSNGNELWRVDLNKLAPERVPWLPSKYGEPHADVVSGITTTDDGIWFILKVGSAIPIPEDRRDQIQPPVEGLPTDTFKQPTGQFLVHYDYDGHLKHITPFVDDGALIVMGFDGRMFVTTLSITTTIAYYGANSRMPFFMRNTPKPVGGLVAYEPESFFDYFVERALWTGDIAAKASVLTADDENQTALMSKLRVSLSTLHLILNEAHRNGEISEGDFQTLSETVSAAQGLGDGHPALLLTGLYALSDEIKKVQGQ